MTKRRPKAGLKPGLAVRPLDMNMGRLRTITRPGKDGRRHVGE